MKRKLALILAGSLAISPISANITSIQTFAAEQIASDEISAAALFSVLVTDEKDTVLEESAEYSLEAGETRVLKAAVKEAGDLSSYSMIWSSETPEIVTIDEDGKLTALSSGTGRISLDILSETNQLSFIYTIEVTELENTDETPDAAAETTGDAEATDTVEAAADAEAADDSTEATANVEATDAVETAADTELEITDAADDATVADSAEATMTGATAETATAATTAVATEIAAEVEPEITDVEDTAATADAATTDADGAAATSAAATAEVATAATTAAATEVAAEVEPGLPSEIIVTGTLETDNSLQVSKAAAAASVKKGKTVKAGWVSANGNWSYVKSDGSKATGLLKLSTSTFYLNEQGVMLTGWIRNNGNYYYADEEGRLQTGWQTIGGSTYYLDPETFARKTGIARIDDKLYVFDTAGKRQTGPKWYNSTSGKCYVYGSGKLHTGWLQRGGKWYYLTSKGVVKTGKLVLGGKIYFFDKNGAMRTGFYSFSGNIFYLTDNGALKGWQTIDGRKYFFNGNCLAKTGWYKPGNRVYYFDSRGRMMTGLTTVDGLLYYLRQDGIVTKGWKKIGDNWYYLNARSRALTGWLTLGDKKYHLNKYGVMDTGSKTIGGVRYYFGSDGVLIPSTNSYSNTEEFIECIAPLIKKYAPQWNVKVYSPIIAQAILESASGQSSLGKKYNNFFGLKCGTLWTGKSVNLATGEEYTPGTYTTIYANFRVYDNMEEGVKGYFEFLFKNRTRYNNLIGETDPYRYLEKIKADGYATSSRYVQNTYNVIKSYNLTRFDD